MMAMSHVDLGNSMRFKERNVYTRVDSNYLLQSPRVV